MVVDGSDSAGRDAKGPLKRTANTMAAGLKYKKYSNEPDPLEGTKVRCMGTKQCEALQSIMLTTVSLHAIL
jgi:hypothetical protein